MTEEAVGVEQEEVTAEPKKGKKSADDFFSADAGREDELKDFISHMKRPRETVDAPAFDIQDEDGINEGADEGMTGEDKEMLSHFEYTPEHRYTAEFLLIQLDKAIAFSLSLLSGAGSEKYRRRLVKPAGDDYEAEILAALLKKYQMQMSLEWMFVSALVIAYAPMVDLAMKDRAIARKQDAEQARRQYMELLKQQGFPDPSKTN